MIPDGYKVNFLDTQVGCREPLPLERAFIQNFLALATTPVDGEVPLEGMDQLVGFVVDEGYRMVGDNGPNIQPKSYWRGLLLDIDEALRQGQAALEHDAW